MAYDARRGRAVLHGGEVDGVNLGDTWEWDGVNWTQAFPATSPGLRNRYRMAWDSASGRVVFHGGSIRHQNKSGVTWDILGDTWEWDGTDWIQRFPATSFPRRSHSIIYDPLRDRVFLFGGGDDSEVMQADTWTYRRLSPASYATFGVGCVGSGPPPVLAPAAFNLPWVGDTFRVQVTNLPRPGTSTAMLTGFSNTNWQGFSLPFDLGVFGFTGCSVLVAPDVVTPIPMINGTSSWTVPIPNLLNLAGAPFYNQVVTLDPGAPGGASVSNGGAGVVGVK